MINAGFRALTMWQHLPAGELLAAVYRDMAARAPFDDEQPTTAQIEEDAEVVLDRLTNDQ